MFAPLLSSLLGSIAGISDKLNLNFNKISGRIYATYLFIAMSIVVLPILFLSHTENTITPYSVFILFLIIIGSTLQNALFYSGLAKKNLSLLEPIINMEPIFVILIAFAVFPSERSWTILILGVISSLALVYSNIEKDKLKKNTLVIDKYIFIVFLSMILAGFVHTGYKIALQFYSPITLFSLRVVGVAFLLSIFFRPKFTSFEKKQYLLLFSSAIFYAVAGILKNISIVNIGISQTVLILSISPVIAYFGSSLILKEKLGTNKIVASIIISCCVLIASISLY